METQRKKEISASEIRKTLFNFLSENYNITLLDTELNDIEYIILGKDEYLKRANISSQPTPSKSLQECKDEIAKKAACRDWNHLINSFLEYQEGFTANTAALNRYIDQAMLLSANQSKGGFTENEIIRFRDWIEERLYPQPTYCITDDLIREYLSLSPSPEKKQEGEFCQCKTPVIRNDGKSEYCGICEKNIETHTNPQEGKDEERNIDNITSF